MLRTGTLDSIANDSQHIALFLGAHCDDIPIGVGGTLCKMLAQSNPIQREAIVFTGGTEPERKAEEIRASNAFGIGKTTVLDFPDTRLPDYQADITRTLQAIHKEVSDRVAVIFTPSKDDRHQDHRTVAECAYRVFRNHLILEYEIQSYDGALPHPNAYVTLEEELIERKSQLLMENYPSRNTHKWWQKDVFISLARVRGVQANSKYAEAFVARKFWL